MLKNRVKYKIAVILGSALLLGIAPSATAGTHNNQGTDKPIAAPVSLSIENSLNSEMGIQSIHYHVITSVLNVRSGPGTSYSIVGQVYMGDTVWYDSVLPGGNSSWTPIYKGQLEGYVDSRYIEEY